MLSSPKQAALEVSAGSASSVRPWTERSGRPSTTSSDDIAQARRVLDGKVVIDLDEEHSGIVVQKLSERKAELVEMRPSGGGRPVRGSPSS